MRRSDRVLVIFALQCAIFGIASNSASAAWSLQTTPNVERALSNFLWDVSCQPIRASTCTAVGESLPELFAGNESALVERWDGRAWTLQTAAVPRETTISVLSGDSCNSATSCVAVGHYNTAARVNLTLAEVWDGRSWSVQSTPNPAEATYSELDKVACSEASACTAVGYSTIRGTRTAVAERWNGRSWALQTAAVPTGARSSNLAGIACAAAASCIAVGQYTESGGTVQGLSETWDGTRWTVQTVTAPSGARQVELVDVSCTNTTECTAVGEYIDSEAEFQPLAYRWDGRAWALQSLPAPSGSIQELARNVSCNERSSCTTVGNWDELGVEKTLVEHWDGRTWTVQTSPNPRNASYSELYGVACRVEACLAVGVSIDETDPAFTRRTLALIGP